MAIVFGLAVVTLVLCTSSITGGAKSPFYSNGKASRNALVPEVPVDIQTPTMKTLNEKLIARITETPDVPIVPLKTKLTTEEIPFLFEKTTLGKVEEPEHEKVTFPKFMETSKESLLQETTLALLKNLKRRVGSRNNSFTVS